MATATSTGNTHGVTTTANACENGWATGSVRAAKGERLRVHTDERTTTTQPQHTHKAMPTHLLEADVVGVLTEAAAADHHRVLADNACNTVQQQRELAGNDSQTGTSILGMRTHSHTHTHVHPEHATAADPLHNGTRRGTRRGTRLHRRQSNHPNVPRRPAHTRQQREPEPYFLGWVFMRFGMLTAQRHGSAHRRHEKGMSTTKTLRRIDARAA